MGSFEFELSQGLGLSLSSSGLSWARLLVLKVVERRPFEGGEEVQLTSAEAGPGAEQESGAEQAGAEL